MNLADLDLLEAKIIELQNTLFISKTKVKQLREQRIETLKKIFLDQLDQLDFLENLTTLTDNSEARMLCSKAHKKLLRWLASQGIEAFAVQGLPVPSLLGKIRVIETVPADNQTFLRDTVHQVIREGFQWHIDGTTEILRVAEVITIAQN